MANKEALCSAPLATPPINNLPKIVQAQPAQTGSILFAEEVGVPLQNGR